MQRVRRRELLRILAGGAMAVAAPRFGRAQPPEPETYTYKIVDGCEVKADVYYAAKGARKAAVVWIHGGALVLGSRKSVDRGLMARLAERNFAVVSIDYRLAPETKLPAILEDLQDAWRWIRREGSQRLGIDPERVATAGGSAGGYLTLMSGFCLQPRPRALVSYYGYGDITASWYTKPDAFYRRKPPVSKEEADRSVGDRVLSEPPDGHQRGQFYLYCRQNGAWPKEVAGHDPEADPEWFHGYCPVRNVTAEYPPTVLIHGTDDTDVPYSESKNMAAKLAEHGIEHELITVPGADHGLRGAPADRVAQIAEQAAEFIRAHTNNG